MRPRPSYPQDRRTGPAPKSTSSVIVRPTGRVPARTIRPDVSPRTTATTRRPPRQNPLRAVAAVAGLLLGIGLIVMIVKPDPPPPPPPIAALKAAFAKALDDYQDGLFISADQDVHAILKTIRMHQSKDAAFLALKQEIALRHNSEFHPKALQEKAANHAFGPWIKESKNCLDASGPDPGKTKQLIDRGESLLGRHPLVTTQHQAVKRLLDRLRSRVPKDAPTDLERYQELMRKLRPDIRAGRFGPVVTALTTFRKTVRDASVIRMVDDQIARFNDQARHLLDKRTRDAEQLREHGDAEEGLKRFEALRENLKGSAVEMELETRIRAFQAGKPAGP
jgi:hypothetical protein